MAERLGDLGVKQDQCWLPRNHSCSFRWLSHEEEAVKGRATFRQKAPEKDLSGRSFTSLWDCSQHKHMHPRPGRPAETPGGRAPPPAPSCSLLLSAQLSTHPRPLSRLPQATAHTTSSSSSSEALPWCAGPAELNRGT